MDENNNKNIAQEQFNALTQLYLQNVHKEKQVFKQRQHELEAKFGCREPITRNNFEDVIQILKTTGFVCEEPQGTYLLRMQMVDQHKNARVEIFTREVIQDYCQHNNIERIYQNHRNFIQMIYKNKLDVATTVVANNYNFKLDYKMELPVAPTTEQTIRASWSDSKKMFRYINRWTFQHPDSPQCKFDLSIVKTNKKQKMGHSLIPEYTINEANVFDNPESFEIEIECNSGRLQNTNVNQLQGMLRQYIKMVLCGLQQTSYPISYDEQASVLQEYMQMIHKTVLEDRTKITSKYFLGPSSKTLQLANITPLNENENKNNVQINVRKDFVVTDKADGLRMLLYISKQGKMYFLNQSMKIVFVGAAEQLTLKHCLIDGELITLKNTSVVGERWFAAFDIYYANNEDIRALPFLLEKEKETNSKYRYQLLQQTMQQIEKEYVSLDSASKIGWHTKEFYPKKEAQTIFDGCSELFRQKFPYNTDGCIFTHMSFGVGAMENGKAGPLTKTTWGASFKWKPPQYNTIDFLISTVKQAGGQDVVKPIFQSGVNTNEATQFDEYKILELQCGYSERRYGYLNPCQVVLDGGKSDNGQGQTFDDYKATRFVPTEPYDARAGFCNVLLKPDRTGKKQMFTSENQLFEDGMIVEFAYDLTGDLDTEWRWKPLRVRYDKTGFGNDYQTANENWKSIHPEGRITEKMLTGNEVIPTFQVVEDMYYNTPSGKLYTVAMKDFHNLYVKRLLIMSASKSGDSLIDYACGKAGDLPKWTSANLSFVLGIDISQDNLENRVDGACVRYLNYKKKTHKLPTAVFLQGNSGKNIRDGSAFKSGKEIINVLFGQSPINKNVGSVVSSRYGHYKNGFQISSCQFAIHYFFKNEETLYGFVKNVCECTSVNGYFIGTSYDGAKIFQLLQKNSHVERSNNTKKVIWEIIKKYDKEEFPNDKRSLGYTISVYQESINQYIDEYLVNYVYFNEIMNLFGFQQEQKNKIAGVGSFENLFIQMLNELQQKQITETNIKSSAKMSANEKFISFLNNYFIYKKTNNVNANDVYAMLMKNVDLNVDVDLDMEKVNVDLEETKDAEKEETSVDVEEAKEEKPPKIQKFYFCKTNTKLKLVEDVSM